MAQDQLDLTPQDTLALSAAMRRPLTDLFTRIRAIAAHEEMLTPTCGRSWRCCCGMATACCAWPIA